MKVHNILFQQAYMKIGEKLKKQKEWKDGGVKLETTWPI
jgi:hypothetical protein